MEIILNGQPKSFNDNTNLGNIVQQFSSAPHRVVAEVNGEIIKTPQWEEKALSHGDQVELVSIVGGG